MKTVATWANYFGIFFVCDRYLIEKTIYLEVKCCTYIKFQNNKTINLEIKYWTYDNIPK